MKRWLFGFIALAAQAAAAQQGAEPYVDPTLRLLVQPEMRRAIEAAPRLGPDQPAESQVLAGRIALARGSLVERPRVGVFAQLRDGRGLDELRALGAIIGSVGGNIVTAELPIDAIDRLSQSGGLAVIEAAHTVTITHDSSAQAIRLNEVRQLVGSDWVGATGRNTIVGVLDTGIDFTHDDFRTNTGATRILGLWDQTRSGTPPTGFSYGNFCSQQAIQNVIDVPANSALCPQQDTHGHGTHTAGTAAGDGSAAGTGTAFQYPGVAPNADLMIVKGGNGSFSESGIIDGVRWLEQQSRALNRPMVVNLSLGGQTGAHDGSRLYEQAIDDLSRPGFVVVISAGNEGSNGNITNRDGSPFTFSPVFIHGTGETAGGGTRDFTFEVPAYTPSSGRCNDAVGFSFWYEGTDRVRITVVRPNGTTFIKDTGEPAGAEDNPSGEVYIDNSEDGPSPNNSDREAIIQIRDCGATAATPGQGFWTLRVTVLTAASGRPYHFWMNINALGGQARARGRLGFDNRYVVGSPGNARSAVTVGAFATRMCWPSAAGQVCYIQVESLGDLARFSSGGPTRDGRLKPEIVAPGIGVVSVRSSSSNVASNLVTTDGRHRANQGTSMAAPHVTGAIALLMEVNPSVTPDEVKEIFERSAARDAFTSRAYSNEPGSQPSDWWGYGKLDVPAALCGLGGIGGTTFISVTPASDTLPQNATLNLEACAAGVGGAAITFTSTAPNIATVDQSGAVTAKETGSALIIAAAGAVADTTRIVVVPPATVIASGRSVAPASATRAPAGTLLPLLSLNLRVSGFEAVIIESLGFTVTGSDPSGKLIVAQDLNRNGQLEPADRVLGSTALSAASGANVQVATPSFAIAQRDSAALLVGVQLSGAAPNNMTFAVTFVPEETKTSGARSGADDRLEPLTVTLSSAPAVTTVLNSAEVFSLSENPVRGSRVTFNFREVPSTAVIYTLTGRRVRDLKPDISEAGRVIWELVNDEDTRIAPGVYLLVFDVAGRIVREKLFVLTPRN